jgi:3-hydroxyisobutyrate dehydrogenase-like beta-hydroxyacid dehydrogenase
MTAQSKTQQIARADQVRRTPPIAFLGTGRMGGPMAANLARAGFEVRAWNRTGTRRGRCRDPDHDAGRRAGHRAGVAGA